MTVNQLHIAFKEGLDKFDSLNYPDFQSDQIDLILNQAQDTFVKQRYGNTNVKRVSFEETQKRTEDIKNVVVRASIVPNPNAPDNINSDSNFVTLPSNHWIIVQELADTTYTDCNGVVTSERGVYIEAIQHNDYSKLINNPFGKPTQRKLLRLMENGRVELLPETGTTIDAYHLTYIKEPIRINITTNTTCELSNMVHQEIVSIAISIALEGIEARRTQSYIGVVENKQE